MIPVLKLPIQSAALAVIGFFLTAGASLATVPAISAPIPAQQVGAASIVVLDLEDFFGLPGVDGQIMRVNTTSGNFSMELLDDVAPATVQNFLTYQQAGVYTNALVHRSVPGFVVQTGGFTAELPPQSIPTNAPVVNEYNLSNTRGTVAMAKLGGNPNSATNQWFVNLADNSSNLDNQNGGFTVFARVLGTGMQVVDAIAAVPVFNAGGTFDQIPLRDMETGQSNVLQRNLVAVLSVTPSPVYPDGTSAPSVLTFSLENSNPAAITASLTGSSVTLTRVPGASGNASITVTATDINGNEVEQTIPVSEVVAPVPINPLPGVYTGLVGEGLVGAGGTPDRTAFFEGNGFLSITVRDDRSFTGSLRLEGKSLPLKSPLDAFGQAVVTAKRTGRPDVTVALGFASGNRITGMVSSGGSLMPFIALTAPFSGKAGNVHPLSAHRYTVALPSPGAELGHGYATMTVDAKGIAKMAGKLADGTKFTAAPMSTDAGDGNWLLPCYAPVYSGATGMIWGEILIPKVPESGSPAVTGDIGWLRPENAKLAQAAFLKVVEPIGGRYIPPLKGISLLSGNATAANFLLTVDPASHSVQTFSPTGLWSLSNKPTITQTPVPVKLSYTSASGLIKGSFSRMVGGKTVSTPYEAVVFSSPLALPGGADELRGAGFFSAGGAAGAIELSD